LEKRQDSLAVRLRAGDHEAAEELVDVYYEQIFLFMRRCGYSCQLSEDLTQETFLHTWSHIGQLREGKALNSWLYRIACNVSKLYWRKQKGREVTGIEGIDISDGTEAEYDRIGNLEQLGRLKIAVAKLSVKLRQAVILHYMQHLTIAEAANAAGVREGTFKSRLSRALKALRKQVI
jgi:RNA polymerase sigma-70 factor (ECF subfamily)